MSPALIGAGVGLVVHAAVGVAVCWRIGLIGPRALGLGGWHFALSLMAGAGAALIVAGVGG